MKRDFIIAIDQGTTSSRAILFNLKGKPIYSSQKEFLRGEKQICNRKLI